MENRLSQQLLFIKEIDKMKNILRRSPIFDGSRRENDAEHSWHISVMAMLLYEYAADDVDLHRVIKMTLVHDLVEVYAGDTFAYDEAGYSDKETRERAAADKLFGLLPDGQDYELRALWEEFDAMETSDARYAAAIDRLQPFIANYAASSDVWLTGGITSDKILARMSVIRDAAPALWPFVEDTLHDAVKKGYLTS